MTFEEFFKKKKIDLSQLQSSEPALFAEFKSHYNQMGEKSFDHTKKYWFNQLRRRFVPPVEVKAEKVIIENPIAEQTITESLTEPAAPSTGFKPRFKAATVAKPTEEKPVEEPKVEEAKAEPAEATKPAAGFKPRFKAAMVSKPVEEATTEEPKAEEVKPEEPEPPKPTVGFKPRFKASMVSKPAETTSAEEAKTEDLKSEEPPAEDAPKPVGFKPRFNAAKMKPKDPGE